MAVQIFIIISVVGIKVMLTAYETITDSDRLPHRSAK